MSCSLATLQLQYPRACSPTSAWKSRSPSKSQPGPPDRKQHGRRYKAAARPHRAPLIAPVQISSQPTPFGVERYELTPEEEGGAPDTQAGSHPFQLTATFDLNQTLEPNKAGKTLVPHAPGALRDLRFHLPPGLLGNPTATPRCTDVDFSTITENGFTNLCPPSTAVGVAVVTIDEPDIFPFATRRRARSSTSTPAPGEPARFGFEAFKVPVVLDTAVQERRRLQRRRKRQRRHRGRRGPRQPSDLLGRPRRRKPRQLPRLGMPGPPAYPNSAQELPPPSEHSSDAVPDAAHLLHRATAAEHRRRRLLAHRHSARGQRTATGRAADRTARRLRAAPVHPAISIEPDEHTRTRRGDDRRA